MGTIYCQRCGTANSAEARFCRSCGVAIEAPPPQGNFPQQPVNPQYPQYPQQPAAPQYPQQQYPQQPVYPQPLQPAPGYVPQPAVPPKKKKTKAILLWLLLGLVLCCGIPLGYFRLLITPINKTADAFLTALQNKDYASAYALTNADVQTQLGSADGLMNYAEANGLVFTKFSRGTAQRISGTPVQGLVTATLTLPDGTLTKLEVDLEVGADGTWQIMGFGSPAQ